MNNFISKLVDRHADTGRNIQPLVHSRFEYDTGFPTISEDENTVTTVADESKKSLTTSATQDPKDRQIDKQVKPDAASLLIIDPPAEKQDRQKHVEPVTAITPPRQTLVDDSTEHTKPAKLKNDGVIPGERIVTRLQKRYSESIHLIKPEPQERQVADRPVKSVDSTNDAFPALNEQVRPALIDEPLPANGNEKNIPLVVPGIKNESQSHIINTGSKATENTQTINISIGRIEIRAAIPAVETKIVTKKQDTSVLSLDNYLEQRNTGKR